MRNILYFILSFLVFTTGYAENIKISNLPIGTGASVGASDSFPYVAAATNVTKRLTIYDLINVPAFTVTYAPKASPTFTGVVTAPSFVGPLTGNASTATALAANPTDCSAGQYANAIAASGNLTCSAVTTAQLSGTLAVASGGTNSAAALNNNRVIVSSGGAIVESAAITASRALVSDSNGLPTHATTTATEIGYVNGVTSAIQTQLNTLSSNIRALIPPNIQRYTSGSGTYTKSYAFVITSASATAGATYTNNGNTYTVLNTISSSTLIYLSGTADPSSAGTLTKSAGTGDSTITFSTYAKPLYLKVTLVGGGGGGGGAAGSAGTDGTDSTFGSNLTAGKGIKGNSLGGGPGTGGVNVITPTTGQQVVIDAKGGAGQYPGRAVTGGNSTPSGMGGTNPLGGTSASPNTGAGGKGGANNTVASSTTEYGGDGAGAGGYIQVLLSGSALSSTFAYAVGGGGSGGAGGGAGLNNGEAGSAGLLVVEEYFQ